MSTSASATSFADVILEAIRARMVETHTALPGVIELFDETTQTAKIRIPLKRHIRNTDTSAETEDDWPILPAVPVWTFHAGGFHVTLPVAPGDECMVLFLERDASRWYENSQEEAPETRRVHDISDGVALVGLNSGPQRIGSYNASDLVIGNDAGTQSVILREGGGIDIEAAGDLSLAAAGDLVASNTKLGLGAGAEDVLGLLDEVLTLFLGLTVNTTTGVVITPSAATVVALKARIAAVKV